MNSHEWLTFEIIPFQFGFKSADSSTKFWGPLNSFFFICTPVTCHFNSCYKISALLVFLHNFAQDNLEIVVFPLVYWIFISIMTVHLFWAPPSQSCNAFWTELSGVWQNHEETKWLNNEVVYDEFLFIHERMKWTQTSHFLL